MHGAQDVPARFEELASALSRPLPSLPSSLRPNLPLNASLELYALHGQLLDGSDSPMLPLLHGITRMVFEDARDAGKAMREHSKSADLADFIAAADELLKQALSSLIL